MALFLISYSLHGSSREYAPLYGKLQSMGAKKILGSQWAVRGDYTVLELGKALGPLIDARDGILISTLSGQVLRRNLLCDLKAV